MQYFRNIWPLFAAGLGFSGLLLRWLALDFPAALFFQLPTGQTLESPTRSEAFALLLFFPLVVLLALAFLENQFRHRHSIPGAETQTPGFWLRPFAPSLLPFALLLLPAPLWIVRSLFLCGVTFFILYLYYCSALLQSVAEQVMGWITKRWLFLTGLVLATMLFWQLFLFLDLKEQWSAYVLENQLANKEKGRKPARFAALLLLLSLLWWMVRRLAAGPLQMWQENIEQVFAALQKRGTNLATRSGQVLEKVPGLWLWSFAGLATAGLLWYLYMVDPFVGFRHTWFAQLLVALVGLAVLLASRHWTAKGERAAGWGWTWVWPPTWFWAGLFLVALVSIPVAIYIEALSRLRLFLPIELDLAIQNQVLWTLSHDGMPELKVGSPSGVYHAPYFRDHVPLFYYFVAPLYLLNPGPEHLVLLQSLFVASGGLPFLLLAGHVSGRWDVAFMAGLVYLFYPALQIVQLFEVHEGAFAIPLFLWAFYFLEKSQALPNRPTFELAFYLFLFLGGLVREEMGLLSVSLGLYLLASRQLRTGLTAFALGVLQFVVMSIIIQRSFGSGGHYERYYPLFFMEGEYSVSGILKLLLMNPVFFFKHWWDPDKFVFMLRLFLPLAFVPLLTGPRLVLLLLAGFASTILATSTPNYTQGYQYSIILFLPLFYAAALFLKNWRDSAWLRPVSLGMLATSALSMLTVGVFLAPLYRLSFLGPYSPVQGDFSDRWVVMAQSRPQDTYADLRALITQVPPQISVGYFSARIAPAISSRREVFSFQTDRPASCVVHYEPFDGRSTLELLRAADYRETVRNGQASLHCRNP